jgi:hypothetical protein
MIHCQECGHESNDQGVFCKKCFVKLIKPVKDKALEKKPDNSEPLVDKKIKGAEFLDE